MASGFGQVIPLILVSHTQTNCSSSDTYGSLDPDQISGRRELDEGPATTGSSTPWADEDPLVEDDRPWNMGKAREEFNRRMCDAAAPGDGEDPVRVCTTCLTFYSQTNHLKDCQWARDRRNANSIVIAILGPEDMFDTALRGGHREEEDADEFVETMMLVVLYLVVSLLLYIRGRWVERLRWEEQQQRRQLEQREERDDDGLFPPPGDPARDDWAVPR